MTISLERAETTPRKPRKPRSTGSDLRGLPEIGWRRLPALRGVKPRRTRSAGFDSPLGSTTPRKIPGVILPGQTWFCGVLRGLRGVVSRFFVLSLLNCVLIAVTERDKRPVEWCYRAAVAGGQW